jgi:hypothetical protein
MDTKRTAIDDRSTSLRPEVDQAPGSQATVISPRARAQAVARFETLNDKLVEALEYQWEHGSYRCGRPGPAEDTGQSKLWAKCHAQLHVIDDEELSEISHALWDTFLEYRVEEFTNVGQTLNRRVRKHGPAETRNLYAEQQEVIAARRAGLWA